MAFGKPPRGNKKSSTVKTVVLVTVCVLGVLILTSNSTSSMFKATSRIITAEDDSLNIKLNRKIPIDASLDKFDDLSTNISVSEDILGDFPMDIIQHDDELEPPKEMDMIQDTGQNEKLDAGGDDLTETQRESTSDVDDDAESLNDSDVGKQEAEELQEEVKEEQEIEMSTSAVEDETNGSEEKASIKEERKVNSQESEVFEETETKAQLEFQEARDVREKMEQAKIESTKVNSKIPIKASIGNSTFAEGNIIGNSDWELCNVTAGTNYIPCFDNEHQERHCPKDPAMCLVSLPEHYKTPILWPQSRDKIWFHNVPNKVLSDINRHQHLVKVTGEFITFPKGALHYINFLQEEVPDIAWGTHTRVVLDVDCGVASFGGYLFDKDVLTMSFASRNEQQAEVQLALERGIPAISAVMGTQRLPFPSRVFDLVNCVHCKVPWHKDGGILLLEVNRLLRPGGYFVWSATPVYRTLEEDIQIWTEMSALTVAMCWELVTIKKDIMDGIGVAIYHKPDLNECYNIRKKQLPPMCILDDDPNAAWYVPLQTCIHTLPTEDTERGSHWPAEWPDRAQNLPYWLNKSKIGTYGKPAPDDFKTDYEHWKRVINETYMYNLGINWSNIRNVMDMRAIYGGFAAALKDLKLWVLNVVNINSPDTLPIIFERGLFGIYHDWCESFSTYPRTYDLLHSDYLFSKLKTRCNIRAVMAEIDRILRPGGNLIARDETNMIREIENHLKSLHWEVNSTFTTKQEGIISGRKTLWRPSSYVTPI
uniref:probable methyltransferase PMT27 n=1 Tax=Erigeron canadensis TaxID=72917 RepID=UPI001CB9C075|nr:probable methyltransferase PMT27 [Erigeron canadensis]